MEGEQTVVPQDCQRGGPLQKILLKMPMAFNAGLSGIGTNIISVKKWVEMATEGTLRIKTYGPEAGEFLPWLKFGNGQKLYRKMYDKYGYQVKVLPCGIFPPETSGWYTKEIKGLSELKGLKIRFYGLGGEFMRKLGPLLA